MYQRARKFAVLAHSRPEDFVRFAQLQLEAYAVSINALSLIDQKSSWVVLPVTMESTHEVRACKANNKVHYLPAEIAAETTQIVQTHT